MKFHRPRRKNHDYLQRCLKKVSINKPPKSRLSTLINGETLAALPLKVRKTKMPPVTTIF